MKKIIAIVICVVMIAAVFTACSSENNQQAEVKEAVQETAEEVKEAAEEKAGEVAEAVEEAVDELDFDPMVFVNDDTETVIDIMSDADSIKEELGEPISTFEADSCAFQGKDIFNYYDGYQLTINDVDGVKKITAITLVDDTVSLPLGTKIGSSEDEIVETYGDEYEKDGNIYVYTSTIDGTNMQKQLRISVDNGKVSGIEIVCKTEGNEEE